MFNKIKMKFYIWVLGKIYIDMRKNNIYHTGKQISQTLGIMNSLEKTLNEL